MARTVAVEVGGDGITVNVVVPGPVASDLFNIGHPVGSAKRQTVIDSVLVKRVGTPEDVARAVLFFLDRESGFITGQALYVCGGTSITGTGGGRAGLGKTLRRCATCGSLCHLARLAPVFLLGVSAMCAGWGGAPAAAAALNPEIESFIDQLVADHEVERRELRRWVKQGRVQNGGRGG